MNLTDINKGRLTTRDLIVLVALGAVFFAFMLGNRPLSVPDEGRYVEIPREMVVTGDYVTPRLDGVKYFEKPVLFYWLEAFSIKLFGLHEFTLRLWPAVMALSGCLAVAVYGARLFGRLSGLLGSAVLATNVLYYAMSRAIVLDMLVSVLLTVGLFSFLIGTHEPVGLKRRLFLWSFYAASALAVLTKGLIGIVIPGMVLVVWVLVLKEWHLLKTLYIPSGTLIFLLISVPWHVMVSKANPEFFNFYFIHEHFIRYLTTVHGRYQPFWFFVPIVVIGMFPWSTFLAQAIFHSIPSSWRERHEHRDSIFLLIWIFTVFLFFSASGSKLIPYILPIFPPMALLIGRYFAAAWDSQDFPGVRIGYTILLVFAVLTACALMVLPRFWPTLQEIQSIGSWRTVLIVTLLAGAVATWILAIFRGFKVTFVALAVTTALFFMEANAAAPRVDMKSVKKLAVTLKTQLRPGDEVASFQTYYQDLPVYLEKRITVVDWKGELEFGTEVEDTSNWILDSATFWKRWQGSSRVFMITKIETFNELRKNPHLPLFPIVKDANNIIVSNKKMSEDKP